jgi:hypothetical protein
VRGGRCWRCIGLVQWPRRCHKPLLGKPEPAGGHHPIILAVGDSCASEAPEWIASRTPMEPVRVVPRWFAPRLLSRALPECLVIGSEGFRFSSTRGTLERLLVASGRNCARYWRRRATGHSWRWKMPPPQCITSSLVVSRAGQGGVVRAVTGRRRGPPSLRETWGAAKLLPACENWSKRERAGDASTAVTRRRRCLSRSRWTTFIPSRWVALFT